MDCVALPLYTWGVILSGATLSSTVVAVEGIVTCCLVVPVETADTDFYTHVILKYM